MTEGENASFLGLGSSINMKQILFFLVLVSIKHTDQNTTLQ